MSKMIQSLSLQRDEILLKTELDYILYDVEYTFYNNVGNLRSAIPIEYPYSCAWVWVTTGKGTGTASDI
jgi:hypothetical protein